MNAPEKASDGSKLNAGKPAKRPTGKKATQTQAAGAAKAAKTMTAAKTASAVKTATKTPTLPPQAVSEMFRRFHAHEAEPKGELEHTNAFTLLVAVALSAQATDKGVNKATRALFAVADTPEKMLALGEDRVIEHIKTIGLFRNKAKNVMALSRRLIDAFDGQTPSSRAALETLPGVGRKTANVVLNMWFGQPTMAVDTHVFRVANRTGLAPGRDVLEVERKLEDATPAEYARHAHHWLILHGRYVCKARKPECPNCLIADLCAHPEKTSDDGAGTEPATTAETERSAETPSSKSSARQRREETAHD